VNHEFLQELLPLFALGSLEPGEQRQVQAHLDDGCEPCAAELASLTSTAAAIGLAVDPVEPPPSLREKVLRAAIASDISPSPSQVWKSWTSVEDPSGLGLVRADEGRWESIAEGITVKRLSFDADRGSATMLIRMQAGTRYPSHRHGQAEECFVVSGDLHIGDEIVMHAGDFQRAEPGSVHMPQWTANGCVLLVSSSLEDELLA
jgi:anti-sigma factor ChrR (cupin superfamily)